MAAMHPVYDEDSKLTFSAGLGAYRNEQAAAVGMFYRFSPRVMMNAGASVGNNDNMYNVGLNFALDRVGKTIPTKAVLAAKIKSLEAENAEMRADNAQMKAENAEMKADNVQMKAEIEELKRLVAELISK